MATLPTIFIESTLHAAKGHGVEGFTLPDNQGLLLLPAGLTVAEQYSLIKQMAAGRQSAQSPPAQPAPVNTSDAAQPPINCQVSVEERAQLFKFLTG